MLVCTNLSTSMLTHCSTDRHYMLKLKASECAIVLEWYHTIQKHIHGYILTCAYFSHILGPSVMIL